MKVLLEIYRGPYTYTEGFPPIKKRYRGGKWYTNGEMEVAEGLALYKIWDIVEALRKEGKLPGLQETDREEGHTEFIVRVDVPDHEHRHPFIIM